MRLVYRFRNAVALVTLGAVVLAPLPAQVAPAVTSVKLPPGQTREGEPAKPEPAKPKPQTAGAQAPPGSTSAVAAAAPLVGGLSLQNANLAEVVDQLARTLKINYIMDPRVQKVGVTLNTYGEAKDIDARAWLDNVRHRLDVAIAEEGSS